MRERLPGPSAGLRIGLFGGSFNPAHAGHRHVAETAMKRLRLDAVWWIVARGSPLKTGHGDFGQRRASAERIARGPRHRISDIEARLGLTYTVDTVAALQRLAPGARFVWVMGADSAAGFHRWKDWTGIASRLPLAIVSRPGNRLARAVPLTRRFARVRVKETAAAALPDCCAPAWVYLRARENPLTSTRLRSGA